jgi:oxygen-independent coproporphyrinogen-3 oxidase
MDLCTFMPAPMPSPEGAVQVPLGLLAKYARPAPRYTSYPPIPAWRSSVGPAEYAAALEAADDPDPISLYVHLPFCPRRCLYCGCNVAISRRQEPVDAYLDRLERELDLVTAHLGRGRRVAQLHLGGGTPNHLEATRLERLQAMLGARFGIETAEASAELDPRLCDRAQLEHLRRLGFARLSFGVLYIDPVVQRAIGRVQDREQIRRSVEDAREMGFEGVNLDLIYGLPEQTAAGFRRTIEAIVALEPDRVACFGYAHVPTVRPHQRALDRFHIPGPQERFALNRIAIEGFTGAGYVWLGLDHFVRPGDPLAVAAEARRLHRNFNGYTVMPARHLVAVGMSAIGEVGDTLVQNDGDLAGWHARIGRGELATVRGHRLSEEDRRRRAAILSLMCQLELPGRLAEGLEAEWQRLARFSEDGLIEQRGDALVVTPLGRYFLRTLCTVFDTYSYATGTVGPMAHAV